MTRMRNCFLEAKKKIGLCSPELREMLNYLVDQLLTWRKRFLQNLLVVRDLFFHLNQKCETTSNYSPSGNIMVFQLDYWIGPLTH